MPRGRRLKRAIVATAAVAATLLSAATSQAANTLFTIITPASSMKWNIDVDTGAASPLGVHRYHFSSVQDLQGAQFGGSPPADTNKSDLIFGDILGTATGVPGTAGSTLKLDPGAYINLGNNGFYWPTGASQTQAVAQLGFDSADYVNDINGDGVTSAWAALRGLQLDFGTYNIDTQQTTLDGGPPATWLFNDLYLDTNSVDTILVLAPTAGTIDFLLGDFEYHLDASEIPIVVSPDGGATPIFTWHYLGGDESDPGMISSYLILPFNFAFASYDSDLDATFTFSISGQIVAINSPIPEPATITLLAIGVVLLYGARARVRRRVMQRG